MNNKGYTTLQMLIVMAVLGVCTLATIGLTSNAYKDNSEELYDEKVHLIMKQAKEYGKTLTNLKDEKNLIITVNDLVKNDYYVADNKDGEIVDPRNSKATLNGLKLKLSYNDDGSIDVEVLEEN